VDHPRPGFTSQNINTENFRAGRYAARDTRPHCHT
jgi:hypothetical protein